ncbi:alpha-galactosidase A [Gautieria morchelliformis]|nr:alpha-galactosidase A [Gautieria morchelliformis]
MAADVELSNRRVLAMDVDPSNTTESEYRILLGDRVKYFIVDPGTYDDDVLSFPPDFLDQLPELPPGDWTQARVFRQSGDRDASILVLFTTLAGIRESWHPNLIDVLSVPLIAKIARFEFEIPSVQNETVAYKAIDGHGIGPAFLGHLTEHGRIMGFLIEKIEGRRASIVDLEACQKVVRRLHSLNIVHGDLNRHNFIVSSAGVTLIDFEGATLNGCKEAMEKEIRELAAHLTDGTGRGARFPDSPS